MADKHPQSLSLAPYLRGIRGRCPSCGVGKIGRNLVATHQVCPHCGQRLENQVGDFTGAAAIAYGVVSIPILMLGLLLVMFTEAALGVIMALGFTLIVLGVVLTYIPIKGLWMAFLIENDAMDDVKDFLSHLQ